MAAAEVDLAYVSGHLGLDPSILVTLTSGPTVDLVLTLLQAIALKAHEFDDLYANKLQIAIELENAVRSSETRSQTYKSTAENALKEVEQARQKLKDEGRLDIHAHRPRRYFYLRFIHIICFFYWVSPSISFSPSQYNYPPLSLTLMNRNETSTSRERGAESNH